MVVEDDYTLRGALLQLLELDEFDVTIATDGVDALEKLPPGDVVVVLDLMMPRLDGFGFVAELERRGVRDQTQLLVLTADRRASEKAEAIGADAWLEKPFDAEEFLQTVSRLAGSGTPPGQRRAPGPA